MRMDSILTGLYEATLLTCKFVTIQPLSPTLQARYVDKWLPLMKQQLSIVTPELIAHGPPQNHCGTIACALSLAWLHSNLDYNVLAVGLKQVKPLNLYEKAFACWEGHPRNRCKETVNLSYSFFSRPTTFIRVYLKIAYIYLEVW